MGPAGPVQYRHDFPIRSIRTGAFFVERVLARKRGHMIGWFDVENNERNSSNGRATAIMKKDITTMRKGSSKEAKGGDSLSQLIDARIKDLGDWRGEILARVRRLIKQADPEVVEEWKWRGVPVWSHAGMICTGE